MHGSRLLLSSLSVALASCVAPDIFGPQTVIEGASCPELAAAFAKYRYVMAPENLDELRWCVHRASQRRHSGPADSDNRPDPKTD